MSALSAAAAHLLASQRTSLAKALAADLQNPESALALCDLAVYLVSDDILDIYSQIWDFYEKILAAKSQESSIYEPLAALANAIPRFYCDIVGSAAQTLGIYAVTSPGYFIPEFNEKILPERLENVPKDQERPLQETIGSLFVLLDAVFAKCSSHIALWAYDADNVLLCLLGAANLAEKSSLLLLWRATAFAGLLSDSPFIWNIIYALNDTGDKLHRRHAYVLWLRALASKELVGSHYFQNEVLPTEKYWAAVQSGLSSELQELRKLSLSVLQLSILSISGSFSNRLFTWKESAKAQYEAEWRRYATLFEILGVDTSLHQAEAAVNDIVGLISPKSLLHPSWGLCLLATGFRATMDSVRKFSLHVLFSIPSENLHLLQHGLGLLEDTFLPYAMQALHFCARKSISGLNCVHGNTLQHFVGGLAINGDAALAVLKVLDTMRDAYDPARIYVAAGLLQGLKKPVLDLQKHASVLRLAERVAEGPIFGETEKTIVLRLLTKFVFTGVTPFITSLETFVRLNGFTLIRDHLPVLANYALENGVTAKLLIEAAETLSPDSSVLCVALAAEMDAKMSPEVVKYVENSLEAFVAALLSLGLDFSCFGSEKGIVGHYTTAVHRLANGQAEDTVYEAFSGAIIGINRQILPQKIDANGLLETLKKDLQSSDQSTLSNSVFRFRAFNLILGSFKREMLEESHNISLEEFLKFKSKVLCNAPKSARNFYKTTDDVFGEYFRTIEILVKNEKEIPGSQIDALLIILDASSAHHATNKAIVGVLSHITAEMTLSEAQIGRIVALGTDLWHRLDASRLLLHQRDVHVALIELLTLPEILKGPFDDRLWPFIQLVISNSETRRMLLPALAKGMATFQTEAPQQFERITWLPMFLVQALTLRQLGTHAFLLEDVISRLYDTQLAGNPDIYSRKYGPEEASARANLLAIACSLKSCNMSVLDGVLAHKALVTPSVSTHLEWRRLQLLTVALAVAGGIETEKVVEKYLDTFIELVESEPSPLVRVYVEWLVARYVLCSETHTNEVFSRLDKWMASADLKPRFISLYQRILYLALLKTSPQSVEALPRFCTSLLTGTSSNKATLRHFSVSLACLVHEAVLSKKLAVDSATSAVVCNIYNAAVVSPQYGQYRSGDALLWEVEDDLTLVGLAGGVLLRVSDREVDYVGEEVFHRHLSTKQVALLRHPIGEDNRELWVKREDENEDNDANKTGRAPLQTKSGAWTVEGVVDTPTNIKRSDLVVVASLVDKPPNLGGICRLCDVLGAGTMTVDDIRVKGHPQFRNVAVTADSWMPMEEVKMANIKAFLHQKKREGYTLVGLEQTDSSVQLSSDVKFPKKTVLLIGKEKEGVPGDLLAELDFCVEIKQVGVVRSMNIQTATAVVVHAYLSQHC